MGKGDIIMQYYEINEAQARQAKQMWSFSDYIEGSETEAYRKRVDEIYVLCETVQDDRKEKAFYYADMYAKKLAENINKGFRIELQCPSIMISGASNFPVRKKERQNAARDRNMQEHQYIQGYFDKIKDLIYGGNIIKSGDENAVEMLREKVDKLENLQSEMKSANAYYRKHKTMVGYGNTANNIASELDGAIKSDYYGCPYPSFKLTNNNAKLKAAKQRLEQLSKAKAKPITETENKYFKIIENTEIMRLQLIFDGKPSAEIRDILKSNGYNWSGKNMAWQRQLTNNAKRSVQHIVIQIDKLYTNI